MANALVDVAGTTDLNVGVVGVPGAVVLNSASTYTGTTTINAGALRAGAANVFAPTSAFTVASGAVLDLNSFNQTIGTVAGAGNVTLGTGSLTISGTGNTTLSGVLSGSGALIKNNTGTFTLTGANSTTFTGAITVSGGGVLSYGNQLSLGTVAGSGVITLDNGTLYNTLVGNAGTFSPATRNIVLGAGGGTLRWDGTATATDLIIVQTGTVISGTSGGALEQNRRWYHCCRDCGDL